MIDRYTRYRGGDAIWSNNSNSSIIVNNQFWGVSVATNIIWFKVSGVWKQCITWVNVGGVWKEVNPNVKVSGVWN